MSTFGRDLSKEELMHMREEGLSNAEIAERLDVSAQTVYARIGKNPPEIRSRVAKEASMSRGCQVNDEPTALPLAQTMRAPTSFSITKREFSVSSDGFEGKVVCGDGVSPTFEFTFKDVVGSIDGTDLLRLSKILSDVSFLIDRGGICYV